MTETTASIIAGYKAARANILRAGMRDAAAVNRAKLAAIAERRRDYAAERAKELEKAARARELVRKAAIRNSFAEGTKTSPILKAVCLVGGISADELCGPSRAHQLVRWRFIAVHILRHEAKLSLARIGLALGGRDHATILYATRQTHRIDPADLAAVMTILVGEPATLFAAGCQWPILFCNRHKLADPHHDAVAAGRAKHREAEE